MKVFSQKRPFLFGVSVTLALMALMSGMNFVNRTIFPDLDTITEAAISLVVELALGMSVILIGRHICISRGWFRAKGTVKGLMLGWLAIFYAVVMVLVAVITEPVEYWIVPKPWPLFVAVGVAFAVGLFEEVLMRGIVLNVLLNKKGDTRKDIIKACWISSAIFGAIHMFNAIAGAGVIETVGQAVFATFAGMFFAAVYIRTKSLWAPIILHAVFDLPEFIMIAVVSAKGLEDMVQEQAAKSIPEAIISTITAVVLLIPFLIASLVLLRKKKIGGLQIEIL